jgi:hypothetical protein
MYNKYKPPFWPWLNRQKKFGDRVGALARDMGADEPRHRAVFWEMFKSHANLRRYLERNGASQCDAQTFDTAVAEWRRSRDGEL